MIGVILDADSLGLHDPRVTLEPLAGLVKEWQIHGATQPEEVAHRIAPADIVLVNKVRLGREQILSAPALKFISIMATGTDNVDLQTAAEKNIPVSNAVNYATPSVVEHTLALMLSLSRNLNAYHDEVRHGSWQKSTSFCLLNHPLMELRGKSLGILGYGTLGQGVAQVAKSLGMNILLAERPGEKKTRDNRVTFNTLLKTSDVISLHCPLTSETQHIMNREAFAQMKKGALLINTARGGLVDSKALIEALESGQVGGAALDVLKQEPPTEDEILLSETIPNLLITPHNAWGAVESRRRLLEQMKENLQAFLDGSPIRRVS